MHGTWQGWISGVGLSALCGAGHGVALASERNAREDNPAVAAAANDASEEFMLPPPTAGAPAAPDSGEQSASPFSIQVSLDYATAYFYRGIIQEDSGLILQPAGKLTVNVAEGKGAKLDVFAGTWNSFHGQKTASNTRGDFTEYWYESDLYAGATLTLGQLSLTGQYIFLTSPNDAFETVQEVNVIAALDDSPWLGAWAMKPYALLAIETGADASDGADSDTGVYLELGIAPGFSFDVGKTSVAITFPVSVGLSLNDYYQNAAGEDETFGFVSVGGKASIPLPIAEKYGAWTLNAGIAGLFLGDHTKEYNAGEDSEAIGTVGLQVNF